MISKKYLIPNYHQIAHVINIIHGSKYTSRHIKYIHKGKQKKTQDTIKIEIESMVGKYEEYFESNGKPKII